MFIAVKNTRVIAIHELEWRCRKDAKGMSKPEYWAWVDSITSGNPPVSDYSGETGYTIVECTDENVQQRLVQLDEYLDDTSLLMFGIGMGLGSLIVCCICKCCCK